MTNGVDRLERLFSRRKDGSVRPSSGANRPSSLAYPQSLFSLRRAPAATTTAPPPRPASREVHFPSPSFIRPKAARMVPRDDSAPVSSRPATANARPGTGAGTGRHPGQSGPATRGPPALPRPGRPGTVQVIPPTTTTASSARTTTAGVSDGGRETGAGNYLRYSSVVEPSGERRDGPGPGVPGGICNSHAPRPPKRSSSLMRNCEGTIAPLSSFNFYHVPRSRNSLPVASFGEISPRTCPRPTAVAAALPEEEPSQSVELPRLQHMQNLPSRQTSSVAQQRADTPPLSDHGESNSDTLQTGLPTKQRQPPDMLALRSPSSLSPPSAAAAAAAGEPTPEPSPQMAAVADFTMADPRFESKRDTFVETPLLRRDSVFSTVLSSRNSNGSSCGNKSVPSTSPHRASRIVRRPMSLSRQRRLSVELASSPRNSVLLEPNVGDFLSLSDDDIAEAVPVVASAPAAAAPAAAAAAPTAPSTSSACVSTAAIPRPTTPVASTKDTDGKCSHRTPTTPSTVTRTPLSNNLKRLALEKPLPATPPVSSVSPPVSPTSTTRRRALHREATPPSHPPLFRAPRPPSSLSASRPRTPAGQARMAAAFEIARIASQYHFDLAYIAHIGPKSAPVLPSLAMTTTATIPFSWPSSPASGAPGARMSRTNSQTSCGSLASRVSYANSHHKRQGSSASNESTRSSVHNHENIGTHLAPPAPVGLANRGSRVPVNPRRSKLEARFLAAYGLATVQAPYNLSSRTHARVLHAKRWVHLSEPNAKPGEFARGYGCAFHRGGDAVTNASFPYPYERRPSTDSCDADTEQDDNEDDIDGDASGRTTPRPFGRGNAQPRTERRYSGTSTITSNSTNTSISNNNNNRGIVFVAYRRKEAVDPRDGSQITDDLEALYRDVEALVEKILDANLLQQPQSPGELQRLPSPGQMLRQSPRELRRPSPGETLRTMADVNMALAAALNGGEASCMLGRPWSPVVRTAA
ncbi:hypothetical protein SPI_01700 [Niveomyces insectorum RCEF 264]|uniref:Uncharacterized protein n=1 Tax=Niveomyces insectorum RCEF 264 TaxID=1081102 RepID=A0A167Z5M3_9HYPO|nr:hypothetical protein SPI_01700 [Niveomyces insectorum RCEF 264]